MSIDIQKSSHTNNERSRNKSKYVLIIVVICLLFTASAFAYKQGLHENFIALLNIAEEESEIVENFTETPEASVQKNGVTITINQTIADPYGIYILYEIIAPLNIEFTEDVEMKPILIAQYENAGANNGGSLYNINLENKGNRRVGALYQNYTSPIKSGIVKMKFNECKTKITDDTTNVRYETLLEGPWEVEWDFNYVDSSKTYKISQKIKDYGENKITKVVISPIGLYLFIEGDNITDKVNPTLHLNDGGEISLNSDVRGNTYIYRLKNEADGIYENELFYRFEHVINPDDVKSVSFVRNVIPLNN